jgi:hypothetical protein
VAAFFRSSAALSSPMEAAQRVKLGSASPGL